VIIHSRPLAIAAFVLLAIACAGDRKTTDTAAVTSTAANGAVLGDTALAQPGAAAATNGAAAPAGASSPAAVPNGAPDVAPHDLPAGRPPVAVAPPAGVSTDTAHAAAAAASAAPLTTTQPAAAAPAAVKPARPPLPYSAGERLAYDVKFSSIDVGDAVMEVLGLENVRGRQALHIRFNVKGGTLFYKVNDRYESWIDTVNLVSLRHWQQIDEGSYERERKYEIMPEIGVYKENDKPTQPTVAEPLDDGSFFYFLRTIPLEVGKTYTFDRYFKPDRNPVTITVVRRERIKVPAGTFDAIVLHPTIKAKGVFGEGGQAEIWVADDSSRIMLQMKSKLKIGSLNLYLKQIRRGGS